jgi:CRP/FNR family transcriptional regulator, cyclic AMP receptor protein
MSAQILEKVEIFSDLTQDQLEKIYALCKEATYFQDEVIFAENSPSNEFYILLEGEVAIQLNPDMISSGKNHHAPGTVSTMFAGQSFGDIALVDQGVRSASAICRTMQCKTLIIQRNDLMDLLKQDPQMGFVVMTNLATDLCTKIRLSNLNLRGGLI